MDSNQHICICGKNTSQPICSECQKKKWLNKIHKGDSLEILRQMPSEFVDMVMTSPPYWGLRDYGNQTQIIWDAKPDCEHDWQTNERWLHRGTTDSEINSDDSGYINDQKSVTNFCSKCGAWRGQLGLEPTPELYVKHLVEIFREVRRVLKKSGTLWLNLGDSYAGGGGVSGIPDDWISISVTNRDKFPTDADPKRNAKKIGLKQKDLVGIPWRVAFALQADGWWLRQDIIWEKPAPMPESVTDRCTKSHEYIFLLAKNKDYYYDNEAIKEDFINLESLEGRKPRNAGTMASVDLKNYKMAGSIGEDGKLPFGQTYPKRNKRSVWTIQTSSFSEAHFATFPEELVEIPIKAGTSEKGVCPQCGKAWERIVISEYVGASINRGSHLVGGNGDTGNVYNVPHTYAKKDFKGWQPTCQCNKELVPAVVMDIFSGSGTTSVVAKRQGRNYIGIELNNEYVQMSEQRLSLVGKENIMNLRELRQNIKQNKSLAEYQDGNE